MRALALGLAASSLALCTIDLQAQADQQSRKKKLTFEQTLGGRGGGGVSFGPTTPAVSWVADGRYVEFQQDGKTLWLDPSTMQTRDPDPSVLPASARRGGRGAQGARGRRGRGRGRGRERDVITDGAGDLFLTVPGNRPIRVTNDGAPKSLAAASPDRKSVSFVRDHNLFVVDMESGEEWAVTTTGHENLFYGELDWVYQEEIYGRGDYNGHWWSPDSNAIAFLRLDESAVKDFTVVNNVPEGFLETEYAVEPFIYKYPKAGDPNPRVGLGVALPGSRTVTRVDLSKYRPEDEILITRVGWTPDGSQVLFQVMNRIQNELDLNLADPDTGEITTLLHEESDEWWIPRPGNPRWLEDGSFLWLSEKTGYKHIYHHEADGELRRAVTSGEWQVRNITRLDEEAGKIWFTGTRDGALNGHVYRVDMDGRNLVRLTQDEGSHNVDFNHDASFFLDTRSSMSEMPEVRLADADGQVLRRWQSVPTQDMRDHAFTLKQRLEIPARDGYVLDGSLLKPPDFAPDRKYPIYLPTYSGPNSGSVRNSFAYSAHDVFLAQQGILVLQVNVRSASGRGLKHTATAYKQLGVQELNDLEDAVAYTIENFSGDPERVAISGGSYGGFMAAYALTHSTMFSLGLAGSGVYDWRLYDTIYTERYMQTPQLNPEGYDKTSVIKAAANLHGHLVITHGTRDDNVHMQNTMQLIYELEKANKMNFELMLYPRSFHGIGGDVREHRARLVWNAIRKNFGLE